VKPRVQFELRCLLADAITVRDALTTELVGRPTFAVDVQPISRLVPGETTWLVLCHARFAALADAQSWYDRIVSRWTSGPLAGRILAASRVSLHSCTHDDPMPSPCVVSSQAVK
jgi:hypothetical protein